LNTLLLLAVEVAVVEAGPTLVVVVAVLAVY